MTQLALLGTPEVVRGGRRCVIAGQRRQSLVAMLAIAANHDVPVETLVDRVWSDLPATGARRALRSEVHRLRDLLKECASIETRPAGYRLTIDGDALDIAVVQRLAVEARAALADTPRDAVGVAERALALWRGRPFGERVDVPEVDWERQRLEETRIGLLTVRIDALLAIGAPSAPLVEELSALTSAWPYLERFWAQLMTALWRAGRQADALDAYQRARALLADTLGVEPSPELRAVEAAILRHDREALDLPTPLAPHGTSVRSGRLDVEPLASRPRFIGRTTLLAELGDALHRHRLVTLTGTGGIGKSRLALELTTRHGPHPADGVVAVDLAAVTDPSSVAAAMATLLGVQPQPDRTLMETIADALGRRHCLLRIDNCEHVRDAIAELLSMVLRVAPSVSVLATSREPLGLALEQVWPVPPLEPATEGAALFCDRARASDATFQADHADLDAIAGLCLALDGLPLAIELAASRVRAFGTHGLRTHLTGGTLLDLPIGTDKPFRHRTLRSAIGWSYDLLDAATKSVFRSLAVFVSSVPIDAVVAVCEPEERQNVAAAVASLVDKSLLVRVSDGPNPRYAMLETIRQFASETLRGSNDETALRRHHAAHFAQVVTRARTRCSSAEEPDAYRTLMAEWPNIRLAYEAAWSWADPDLLGQICGALGLPCLFYGLGEAGSWASKVIDSGVMRGHPSEGAVRGASAVYDYWFAGDPAAALATTIGTACSFGARDAAFHLAAFMGAQAIGDAELTDAITRRWLAGAAATTESRVLAPALRAYHGLWMGDLTVDIDALCVEAVHAAMVSGSPGLSAYALIALAQVRGERDPHLALRLCDRATSAVEGLPTAGWLGSAPLGYRAAALARVGDMDTAIAATRELLEFARSQQMRQVARHGLWTAALCLHRAERPEAARTVARLAGGHAGRGSLGVAAELDRRLGSAWRDPPRDAAAIDLLDALDIALTELAAHT